jgi:hypothetical protein
MGGLFSSPSPPAPPDTSEEEKRRADAVDAQERSERRKIASRSRARAGGVRMLMSQVRPANQGTQNQFGQSTTLGGQTNVRNPRGTA